MRYRVLVSVMTVSQLASCGVAPPVPDAIPPSALEATSSGQASPGAASPAGTAQQRYTATFTFGPQETEFMLSGETDFGQRQFSQLQFDLDDQAIDVALDSAAIDPATGTLSLVVTAPVPLAALRLHNTFVPWASAAQAPDATSALGSAVAGDSNGGPSSSNDTGSAAESPGGGDSGGMTDDTVDAT